MRYCYECEKSFAQYQNSFSRKMVLIVILLLFVVTTAIVVAIVSGGGEENKIVEPTVYVKPGDPIAPRNSKDKLSSDFAIIGLNAEDELIYFKDSTEVVIGDEITGYSNPVKIKGTLK